MDIGLGLIKTRDHLRLDGNGSGTHFIISPVEEVLNAEIDDNSNNEISKLKKYY
ncbi:hypothetical protein MKS77_15760 [Acinetobacter baumannii]